MKLSAAFARSRVLVSILVPPLEFQESTSGAPIWHRARHICIRGMCGRYTSYSPPVVLRPLFRTTNPVTDVVASWNVAPLQSAIAVRRHPHTGEHILDPAVCSAWLGEEGAEVAALLLPASDDVLWVWPVKGAVILPLIDRQEMLAPISTASASLET